MTGLAGCAVLVVEDNAVIAWEIEALLKRAGCTVIGPATRLAPALEAIRCNRLDGAVLDLNLGDEMGFPAADALADADVPFVILTGHSPDILPDRHKDRPILMKPFGTDDLLDTLKTVIRDGGAKPSAQA